MANPTRAIKAIFDLVKEGKIPPRMAEQRIRSMSKGKGKEATKQLIDNMWRAATPDAPPPRAAKGTDLRSGISLTPSDAGGVDLSGAQPRDYKGRLMKKIRQAPPPPEAGSEYETLQEILGLNRRSGKRTVPPGTQRRPINTTRGVDTGGPKESGIPYEDDMIEKSIAFHPETGKKTEEFKVTLSPKDEVEFLEDILRGSGIHKGVDRRIREGWRRPIMPGYEKGHHREKLRLNVLGIPVPATKKVQNTAQQDLVLERLAEIEKDRERWYQSRRLKQAGKVGGAGLAAKGLYELLLGDE